MEALVCLLILL